MAEPPGPAERKLRLTYLPEAGEEINIVYTVMIQQKNVTVTTAVVDSTSFYENVYMYAWSEPAFGGSKDSNKRSVLDTNWQFMAPFKSYTEMKLEYRRLFRTAGVKIFLTEYNVLTGKYGFGKRSKDLLKVKKMHTCDIKCIGVEEGEGKYAGVLGKIVCDYKGFTLRVGSGFTDEQRLYYWNNQQEIVNQLVEIQYFEESKDKKTGDLSLRFPVFKRVRDDKDEVSYD